MRIRLKYGLPIALVMLSGMLTAQMRQSVDPNTPPPGDPRSSSALAILTQSLAAMTPQGSSVTGASITSLRVSGTFDRLDASRKWVSGTFRYIDDLNPQHPEYKRSTEWNGSKYEYWSNHGDPGALDTAAAPTGNRSTSADPSDTQSGITKMHNRRFEAQYLPYVVLYQAFTQSDVSVYQLANVIIQGKSYLHLETLRGAQGQYTKPTRRDWYIDSETMLPYVAMELVYSKRVHDIAAMERTTYSAYQSQDGLLCPMEQSIANDGAEIERLHLNKVEINTKIDRSMFDATVGN